MYPILINILNFIKTSINYHYKRQFSKLVGDRQILLLRKYIPWFPSLSKTAIFDPHPITDCIKNDIWYHPMTFDGMWHSPSLIQPEDWVCVTSVSVSSIGLVCKLTLFVTQQKNSGVCSSMISWRRCWSIFVNCPRRSSRLSTFFIWVMKCFKNWESSNQLFDTWNSWISCMVLWYFLYSFSVHFRSVQWPLTVICSSVVDIWLGEGEGEDLWGGSGID